MQIEVFHKPPPNQIAQSCTLLYDCETETGLYVVDLHFSKNLTMWWGPVRKTMISVILKTVKNFDGDCLRLFRKRGVDGLFPFYSLEEFLEGYEQFDIAEDIRHEETKNPLLELLAFTKTRWEL